MTDLHTSPRQGATHLAPATESRLRDTLAARPSITVGLTALLYFVLGLVHGDG